MKKDRYRTLDSMPPSVKVVDCALCKHWAVVERFRWVFAIPDEDGRLVVPANVPVIAGRFDGEPVCRECLAEIRHPGDAGEAARAPAQKLKLKQLQEL